MTDFAHRPPPGRSNSSYSLLAGFVALGSILATPLFAFFYLLTPAPERLHTPPLGLPTAAVLVLVASGAGALLLSSRQARRVQVGTLVSLAGGLGFLALQAVSYTQLPFVVRGELFGSLFAVTVVVHHINAVVGLALLGGLLLFLPDGPRRWRHHVAVVNTALWWYWVVGGWVPVYVTLYLVPRLW